MRNLTYYVMLFLVGLNIFSFIQVIGANVIKGMEGKVIGGVFANISEFPFSVRFFNADAFCSGTILNSWTVMTAAHCLNVNKDVHDMLLGVGSNYLQDYNSKIYEVSSFAIHEDFNRVMPLAADIALLFVTQPIQFSQNVQKAILTDSMQWKNSKEDILVYGWGSTTRHHNLAKCLKFSTYVDFDVERSLHSLPSFTDVSWLWSAMAYEWSLPHSGLMQATLQYVPKKTCEKNHKMTFTDDMFCLYGGGKRDTCQGDSGGGVLWRGKIIGIVSHGHSCALKDKPGVYISVWQYRNWIRGQIKKFVSDYCRTHSNKNPL